MVTIRWSALAAVLKDAWPLGLTVAGLGIAAGLGLAFSSSPSAAAVRAGMFLQLFGVATVAVGLQRDLKMFGHPSLRTTVVEWFHRFLQAFRAPAPVTGMAAFGGHASVSGEAGVMLRAEPGASLEQRVKVLETRVDRLEQDFHTNSQATRKELAGLRSALEHEAHQRETGDREARTTIQEVALGGLHLEVVGIVWLVLGILGASLPDVLARWLQGLLG